MLQEEIERNKEREAVLKKQLDEERMISDERTRKREEALRKQLQEDEARCEERIREIKNLLDAERKAAKDATLQRDQENHELGNQVVDCKKALLVAKEELEREKRLLEDQLNADFRAREEQLLNDARVREEQLNADFRAREEQLRNKELEAIERERKVLKDREDALNAEQQRRDALAANREQELRDQVEKLRQQLQEVRENWDQSDREKLQKSSQIETALRNEIAENKREALEREAALRQQLADAEHTISRAKNDGVFEKAESDAANQRREEERKEWEKMRKSLEDALSAERQRLLAERQEWETELNAERDRMNKVMELELGRLRQEMEEAHKASLDALRGQLDEAKSLVAPSPPVIRRQGSQTLQRSQSRPQPTPPSHESPMRRPFAPPPAATAATQPQDEEIMRTRSLARELEMMKQQRNNLKQRVEELEDELEAIRRREKERIASEVEEANIRIAELRSRRGSLEDAKSDAERKLREANMLLTEQNLQAKKAERAASQELEDLRAKYQNELKRNQQRQHELENQVNRLKDALREAEDNQRSAERDLAMERERAAGQQKTSEVQLRCQVTELHAEVNALRADLARRSEELATKSVDLAAAQGELTVKTSEILQLQSQVANADDKIDALCKNLAERDALVKAQAELSEVEAKRQAETMKLFENECNQHQSQLEALQNMLQKRQEELDCATLEAQAVRKDVDVLKAENQRLREEIATKTEFLRKELEGLRDESHSLERRAFSAEREAAIQKEHADGLQNALVDKSNKDAEGKAVASSALAEAAEQELERLRQQLSTKTDQLLMKDRKEEALRNKLTTLIDEIAPDPDLSSDPVVGAIEKVQKWKAWISAKLAEEDAKVNLLKKKDAQLGLAMQKIEDLKQLKRNAAMLKRTNALLKKKLSKLHLRGRHSQIASTTMTATVTELLPATPLQPAVMPLHVQSAASMQPASREVSHVAFPRRKSEPPSASISRTNSPARARIPLPTKSVVPVDPKRVSPPRRRGHSPRRTEVSPPPPLFHHDIPSPSPVAPRVEQPRPQAGPSVEQIEQMLESMESLINQPLPTQLRTVSPIRARGGREHHEARDMSPPPPPPQPRMPTGSMSPRNESKVRTLLEAHEQSRLRREQKAEELRIVLGGLNKEILEMKMKEVELVEHREKTLATIDGQQQSLLNNVNYWRQQLVKYDTQGIEAEAIKCRARIAQTEEDLMSLVRQKPEMLVKAEQGQNHIAGELIRLCEQKAILETELSQLTVECTDLRAKEAALASVVPPPASQLPNPLPAPRVLN
eukprot:TRINITY_DN21255_c0_g1_i1.p1 TRINITY_DN21255_c0_g1~~TRINITY_DN21255_c0_g1_i1.p1  ORF type:complete len:1501 (+),score=541.46 TRINITY_DN21255_c0_g1_i1:659-4504(+)